MARSIELFATGIFLLLLIPSASVAFAAQPYFGAYPDVAKRDALYVYTTTDFSGTGSPGNKVYSITSSAHQSSGGTIQPYMSQNYVIWDNSDSKLKYWSEVHGISSGGSAINPYSCEDTSGCTVLGLASGIDYVKTTMFWSSGKVKYYVEKFSGGVGTGYYNPDYTPGSDDSGAKFASGTSTVGGKKVKFTQWGVESPSSTTSWIVEQSSMFTWTSAGVKYFQDDKAVTTEWDAGDTNSSHITYRWVNGGYTFIKVGEADYCVHRNNNVDGVIEWDDGGNPSCLSAGTTLWT